MRPEIFSVLHVVGATIAGGAERVAFNMARYLSRRGIRLGVFALSANVDDVGRLMRGALLESNVFFRTGPVGRVGVGALLAYAHALRAFAPNIVHLHTPNTELAHACVGWIAQCRTARTVHNSILHRTLLQRWASSSNRVALSIACSEAVEYANKDWARPSIVIINGVDFEWPIQTNDEMMEARHRLGLDPNVRHYVMVGSMRGSTPSSAQKAHDVAIRAWSTCDLDATRHVLHLIGDGPLRAQLEALAAGNPSIIFHGISSRVSDWLLAADVFVMPSRHEGLPLAGVEALGTGLPCIFSDIPPLRELNPKNVLWCEMDSSVSLARCYKDASGNSFVRESEGALHFRDQYGMEGMADRYLKYYEELLAR